MESNDESSSKLIEEIILTSEDEEEILIDTDSLPDNPESGRSNTPKREMQKFDFTFELISNNSSNSDNNIASESNFIIPHSDSETSNELTLIEEKSDISNTEITEISTSNFIEVNESLKLDENNNINDSLFSSGTSHFNNSRQMSLLNDPKLLQPCSVVLHRITDSTLQNSAKNKIENKVSNKKQSDEESNWSNASNWSTGRKKKVRKKNRSFTSINESISTSSVSSLKPKKKSPKTKKTNQSKKLKETIEAKSSDLFNEDTNFAFENTNYTCQISNNERIKLKISKFNVQKESKNETEEASNHTILLSSRSSSPAIPESAMSKTTDGLIPEINNASVSPNESCVTGAKKNDGLLKTTLKNQTEKVNLSKKSKTNSLSNLERFKKTQDKSFSIKRSIIEKVSDMAIDRTYKIPKLNNRKEDTDNELKPAKPKPKEINGKKKKINKKKKFDKKETIEVQKKSFVFKEDTVQYNKKINKNRPKLESMTRDQIPKLRDLQIKRNEFNLSIGAKYPFFSLLFMFEDYVKKMSTVACLDFDLLIRNSPVEDSELSINSLNRAEQIQLCRLMSRSAGRVNPFELINMDPMLREHPENNDFSSSDPIDFENEDDYFLNSMDDLTMSEAYIFYKRFISRLNSPYRCVQSVRIGNTDCHTLFVTFENDFEIESLDLSIESIVIASLHKPLKKFSTLRNDIHQGCVYIDEDSNSSSQRLIVNSENYDSIRIKLKDEELVNRIFTKSVYEKYRNVQMPRDFYKICNTKKNLKQKIDDNRVERFKGHRTRMRADRGEMRIANKHRILSDYEFEDRLLRLQTEHEIQIDFSQL